MSTKYVLIYCKMCDKDTIQSVLSEQESLSILSNNSLLQKFLCSVCKGINSRLLQWCGKCDKHTEQLLQNETLSDEDVDKVEQKFECKTCGEINNTDRNTDEYNKHLLNVDDEEGGVFCGYCNCYRIQELIDKQHEGIDSNRDLTTYKCKTCGRENYDTHKRVDIR